MLTRLANAYFKALDQIVVICLAGMVVMVFGNVVLRYGFNGGITQSEELSRWLFVWMVFCGAIVVLREGGHIAVDMFVARLPRAVRQAIAILVTITMLGLTWLVIQGALTQVSVNRTSFAPASGLSLSWFFAAGLVFGVSAFAILLVRLWREIRGVDKGAGEGGP
ncbi:TRAP transporter small permease [Mesorhizobium marinum]|uniref:TRAP transporter small permease protein n=1 Tax=Mesorhizobium marinum TaxID=3228790 RepID=A0ABV3QYR0_9HYPH